MTLTDVLEVDGLGINILDKLCQSILSDDIMDISKQPHSVINKYRKNILVPSLSKNDIDVCYIKGFRHMLYYLCFRI